MKTRRNLKIAAATILAAAVIAAPAAAYAANTDSNLTAQQNAELTSITEQTAVQAEQTADQKGPMGSGFGGMGQSSGSYADSPSEIITSTLTKNSAEDLTANTANAQTIVMSSSNNEVKISAAGTYIITGTCSDGNIAVKKGTQDVVLILKDLDLTSTTGATLSLNKGTEVKVIIEGTVKLTDAEDLADEESDDFDGAAIKAKAGSSVVLTGDGTLTVNGKCKNGIKVSDLEADDKNDGYSEASFIIDGENLTINVTAAGDGINSGTDLTIKSGTINVSAADDGIKADYILTIGEDSSNGPTIKINKSNEGIEGATINIYSGNIDVVASDDGINAANSDLTGYTYSLNIMGGTVNVSSGADGIDSNGNINITGGLTTIVKAASNGGEGGLDYNGTCYIAEGTFVNPYGTTMDSGNGGMMGGRGQMPWGGSRDQSGSSDQAPQWGDGSEMPQWGDGQMPQRPGMDGEMPQWGNGQMPQRPGMDGEMGEAPDGSSFATPEDGGQFRGRDRNAPQSGNEETPPVTEDTPQGTEAPDGDPVPDGGTTDTTEKTQSTNWFIRLIEAIKNWFATTFN